MADKSRYWYGELFIDSMPGNWKELLVQTHVKVFASPVHDRDINPDGSIKKAHIHLEICYDGPTTYNNVVRVFGSLVANGFIKRVESARGYYRYLCHLDNPEKAQYDPSEILCFNGASSADLMSETDKNTIKWEVGKIIREKDIDEYYDLVNFLMDEGLQDYYFVVINSTMHFKALCDSRRHKKEKVIDRIINKF